MTFIHAHITTGSRDCDGDYSGSYDMFFNEDELAESAQLYNDFSEIHFMQRVMGNVASPYAVQYDMTVRVNESGMEVVEQTDEGYRAASVLWCREDCAEEAPTRRDHRAESMGY